MSDKKANGCRESGLHECSTAPEAEKANGCRGCGLHECSTAPEADPYHPANQDPDMPLVDRDPGDETRYTGGQRPQTVVVTDRPFVREVERHPSSQSFVTRVTSWVDLHDQKQKDYGTYVDPFANIREGARVLGLPAWIGAIVRMNDKMRRLNTAAKQYIETGQVTLANEGVIDSFDDLGVYSGIGAVMFEEEQIAVTLEGFTPVQ